MITYRNAAVVKLWLEKVSWILPSTSFLLRSTPGCDLYELAWNRCSLLSFVFGDSGIHCLSLASFFSTTSTMSGRESDGNADAFEKMKNLKSSLIHLHGIFFTYVCRIPQMYGHNEVDVMKMLNFFTD